jgi:hypothetical protein
MEWWDTRTTPQWVKITEHNRSPLSVSYERLESKQRMVDGTLRRYVIGKKRTWSCSWDNLPSASGTLLVSGEGGNWMEKYHYDVDGSFWMRLRKGSDQAVTDTSVPGDAGPVEEVQVMITDFSKEVIKRGPNTDLWSLSITLEEV